MTKNNVVSFGTKSCLTKIAEYFDNLADKCCEVINVKKYRVFENTDAESVEYSGLGIDVVFTTEYASEYLSVDATNNLKKNENYNESAVNDMIDEVTEFFKAKVTEEVAAKLGITSFDVCNSSWSTGNLANVTVSVNFS